MRVLLINQYYYPDIAATAQLCRDWAEDLVRLGHEVTVLAGTGRYRVAHHGEQAEPEGPRLPLRETQGGVRIVRVPVLAGRGDGGPLLASLAGDGESILRTWARDGEALLRRLARDGGALLRFLEHGGDGSLLRFLADGDGALLRFVERDGGALLRFVERDGGALLRLLARGGGYASFFGGALVALFAVPRPDVVVALSTPPMVAALGLCAQAALGAGFVYWVQDVYPELLYALGALRPASPVARGLSALSALLYRHADRVIALDEAMADRLVAAGAPRERVRVIDHFADTREVTPEVAGPAAEPNPLRRRLGLSDEFVVCYAGNHGRCHDFDTVLAALAQQAAEGDTTLHWLFVGDGEQRQRLCAGVPAALRGVVHLLPPQARSELPAVLTAGSVGLITLKPGLSGLVAPSKLYGLLSAGCPVVYVGPPGGRIPELIAREPIGAAVASGDAAGLLFALRRLQADAPRRAELGAHARALAVSRYDRPRITAAHAAVLAEVADARAARRR